MIRRRQSVASVLTEDEDEDGLNIFLKRFDLRADECVFVLYLIAFDSFVSSSLETGSITNFNEADPFDESSLDDTLNSLRHSRGKPRSSGRAPRARVRPLDTKSPSSHQSFARKRSLSDTFENIDTDHFAEKASLEFQPPYSTLASLQRHDDFDDEPDELDLLGIPSPPVKRRTSRMSSGAPSAPVSEKSEPIVVKPNAIDEDEPFATEQVDEVKGEPTESVVTQAPVPEEETIDKGEGTSDISVTGNEELVPVEHDDDPMAVDSPTTGSKVASPPSLVLGSEGMVAEEVVESRESDVVPDVQMVQSLDSPMERAQDSLIEEEVQRQVQYVPPVDSQAVLWGDEVRNTLAQHLLPLLQNIPSSPIPDKSLPLPVIITASTPRILSESDFNFDVTLASAPPPPVPVSPSQPRHPIQSNYSIPSLKYLPPEYNRKTRSTKLLRKREKERERNEGRRDRDFNRDDWAPMGLNRWAATISANPVYKRVSRAYKCLSTRDWAVSHTAGLQNQI